MPAQAQAKRWPERPLDAVIFDMDGVVTDTARAHAAAWKQTFDDYLQRRARRRGGEFTPFDAVSDYRAHVDGKPRHDGVRSFLQARGVDLPFGDAGDDAERETVCGLAARKNRHFLAWLSANRARAYPSTIALIDALKSAGVKTAVITSSRNGEAVLESAGVGDLFDAELDGLDLAALGLPGKPDPALLHEATARLGARPDRTAVVEDAVAGVAAAAAGPFALVIGVAREGARNDLAQHGADLVVADLGDLTFESDRRFSRRRAAGDVANG